MQAAEAERVRNYKSELAGMMLMNQPVCRQTYYGYVGCLDLMSTVQVRRAPGPDAGRRPRAPRPLAGRPMQRVKALAARLFYAALARPPSPLLPSKMVDPHFPSLPLFTPPRRMCGTLRTRA